MENKVTKVEKIIDDIGELDLAQMLDYDGLDECFVLMRAMENAMSKFIRRVDKGEVRSTKTYKQFKDILGE